MRAVGSETSKAIRPVRPPRLKGKCGRIASMIRLKTKGTGFPLMFRLQAGEKESGRRAVQRSLDVQKIARRGLADAAAPRWSAGFGENDGRGEGSLRCYDCRTAQSWGRHRCGTNARSRAVTRLILATQPRPAAFIRSPPESKHQFSLYQRLLPTTTPNAKPRQTGLGIRDTYALSS